MSFIAAGSYHYSHPNEMSFRHDNDNNNNDDDHDDMESSIPLLQQQQQQEQVPPLALPPLSTITTTTPTTTTTSSRVEIVNLMLLLPSSQQHDISTSDHTPNEQQEQGKTAVEHQHHQQQCHDPQQQQQQQQQHESSSLLPGENVVVVALQARSETCQEIIAAATAAAAAATHHPPTSTNTNTTTTTTSSTQTASVTATESSIVVSSVGSDNQNNNQPPQQQQQLLLSPITQIVQGVVDLNVLSTIAGVSRSDLVSDWQSTSHMSPLSSSQQQLPPPPPPSIPPPSTLSPTASVMTIDHHSQETDSLVYSPSTTASSLVYSIATAATNQSSKSGSQSQQQQQEEDGPSNTLLPPLLPPTKTLKGNSNGTSNYQRPPPIPPLSSQNMVIDTVLLNADAFVETLTDALVTADGGATTTSTKNDEHIHHTTNTNGIGGVDTADDDDDIESYTDYYENDVRTSYTDDISGVTPGGAFFTPRPENLPDATNLLLSSHMQHAFLLEIPALFHTTLRAGGSSNNNNHRNQQYTSYHSIDNNENNKTTIDLPSHFILALPTKQDGTLLQDDISEASGGGNDDHHENESFLGGLAHLPSDVRDVQIEAIQYVVVDPHNTAAAATTTTSVVSSPMPPERTIRLDVVVKRQVPVIGYVILICGLFSLSSVGTALNLQQNVSPIMKSFWRYTSTYIILLPICIRSVQTIGFPRLSNLQWIYFVICSFCYAFMTSAFVSALELTTLATAFVLSNLAPLFIIVGRSVLGLPVLYMEGLGAMIGFLGGSICTLDVSPVVNADGHVQEHPYAILGDSLAVMASATVAIYFILAKKLRPHIDLFVFTFMLMFSSSLIVFLYMMITNEPMSYSNHIDNGLWGWTNWQWNRLPLELYIAIVCNIFGTTGYIAVMKYFEPIVVSTVMLSEPTIGAIMAAIVGSDPLPGLQTWIGNFIVAIGILLVVWSGAKTTETIDATKAFVPVNNNNNNSHQNKKALTMNSPQQQQKQQNQQRRYIPHFRQYAQISSRRRTNSLGGDGGGGGRIRCESITEE